MKKTILILLCGVIVLCIAGCGSTKNEFKVGEKSNIQTTKNDISLSIKEETLKNTGATFILRNDSDKLLRYDEVYEIEIKEKNGWHKINTELGFNEPLWSVEPKKSEEIELKWEHGYGKLAKGEYRIVKEVYYEEEAEQKFYISAEFIIK